MYSRPRLRQTPAATHQFVRWFELPILRRAPEIAEVPEVGVTRRHVERADHIPRSVSVIICSVAASHLDFPQGTQGLLGSHRLAVSLVIHTTRAAFII